MGEPSDLWRALTTTALRLVNNVEDEPLDVDEIVDATLAQFPDIRDVERYRTSLKKFVRDMAPEEPPPRAA